MLQYNPQEHPNSSLECQVLSIILNKEVMSYILEVCFLFSFLFLGGEGEVTDSYFNIYCKRTWICPIAFKVKNVIAPHNPTRLQMFAKILFKSSKGREASHMDN